jgi:hypothetical protein
MGTKAPSVRIGNLLAPIIGSGTWLLAFVLRDLARTRGETVENHWRTIRPPLAWVKGLGPISIEVPMISAVIVLVILCAVFLLWWRLRPTALAAIGLGLFGGGAAANIAEEITFGSVTDYIPISWPDEYFLNFSDLAVLAGGALLAIAMVRSLARR